MERRLSTIMAADVVGYSARMESAEAQTLGQLAYLMNVVPVHFLEALHRARGLDSGPYGAENVIDGLLQIELIQLIVTGDMSLDLFT